jgi:hypothetical protein
MRDLYRDAVVVGMHALLVPLGGDAEGRTRLWGLRAAAGAAQAGVPTARREDRGGRVHPGTPVAREARAGHPDPSGRWVVEPTAEIGPTGGQPGTLRHQQCVHQPDNLPQPKPRG